jgi:hypothetical protein
MEKWAAKELSQVNLGDVRRNKRLIRIVEDLAAQPDSSVPQACENVAATKAAYNFCKSPYFQASSIRSAHIASTIEIIKNHQIVLAIQDTTNIDLTHHPKTKGVGYLDHSQSSGKFNQFQEVTPQMCQTFLLSRNGVTIVDNFNHHY